MMEHTAEINRRAFVSIPRADHDPSAERGDGNCIVERGRIAAQLKGQIKAAALGKLGDIAVRDEYAMTVTQSFFAKVSRPRVE